MSLKCPWCNRELSLNKSYADSDPHFIFFLYCACKCDEYEFQYNVNQDEILCGYELGIKLDDTGQLRIEIDLGNHKLSNGAGYIITLWNEKEVKKIIDLKSNILSVQEAKEIILKYKKLWIFS